MINFFPTGRRLLVEKYVEETETEETPDSPHKILLPEKSESLKTEEAENDLYVVVNSGEDCDTGMIGAVVAVENHMVEDVVISLLGKTKTYKTILQNYIKGIVIFEESEDKY